MPSQNQSDGPENLPAPERIATHLRWSGAALVAAMLFAGPMAFGAVEAWAWGALWVLAAAAAAIALLVWIREGRATIVFSPAAALAAVLAAVALVQLLPMPSRFMALAGERTGAVHHALFSGWGNRISLAPGGTVEAFFKVTLVLLASFATLVLVRTRGMAFMLVAAVAAAALAASGAGIIQEGAPGKKIYGLRDLAAGAEVRPWRSAALDPALSAGVARIEAVEATDGSGEGVFFRRTVNVGDVFGPYANSNHFGGLLEVALPVLLALMAGLLATRRQGWGNEGGLTGTAEGALVLIITFCVLVGVGAAVYAKSAGALGGLATGFAVALFLMALSRQATAAAIGIFILLAGGAVAAVVLWEGDLYAPMREKLAGRAAVWKTTWEAAEDFPITGSGLGSYSRVVPHYETTEAKFLFAHNDYVQLALEGGMATAGLAGLLALWQTGALIRGVFRRVGHYSSALCAGALGALAAVGFHSLFDYNMHVPANALLLGVILCIGSIAARAHKPHIETVEFRDRKVLSGRRRVAVMSVTAILLLAACGAPLAAVVYADHVRGTARRFLARADAAAAEDAEALESLFGDLSRASRFAPWDDRLCYQQSRLAAFRARLAEEAAAARTLRDASLALAAASTRLAPAFTFYAMTSVTIGEARPDITVSDRNIELLAAWEMSAFGYRRALARLFFERERYAEGLAEVREAIALSVPDMSFTTERATALVVEVLERFDGDYQAVAAAAPDTFGGHVLFGRGLAAAGRESAASIEYVKAARLAIGARRLDGFSEKSVKDLAEARLTQADRADEAGGLYAAVLQRRPGWQDLRLSYAGFLAERGEADAAKEQIDIVLAGDIPGWLKERAEALAGRLQEKAERD